MSQLIIESFEEFEKHSGQDLGYSDYLQITQEQINKFAEATLDHQWIHTDPERAATESQFGTTIAHGYLTLSVVPFLWKQIVEIKNIKMLINYGIDKFRFNQAVKVNDEVRLKANLHEIANLRGITKTQIKLTLEIKGSKKPAFTGICTFLYHFN